jgi:hypothetical protein
MFRFRRVGAFAVAGALAVTGFLAPGCDKKEPPPAPGATGIPPLDQPQNPAAEKDHPVHEPTAATGEAPALPANHPPIAPPGDDPHSQLPAGHPPVAGNAPSPGMEGMTPGDIAFDPKTVLSGVIKLDAKLKDKVKAGDVIFLVARQYNSDPAIQGPPLAVRRLVAQTFPMPFSLDSRDAMLAGTKLSGKVVVTARVDKDGDAMTKLPGDVIGQSKATEPPSAKVVVDLDKVL